jgi:hypothetical protein
MRHSEQKNVDHHGARGWEGKAGSGKKPAGVRFEGDEEEGDSDEEDDMTEIDSQFSDEDYDYEEEDEEGESGAAKGNGGSSGRSNAPKGKYASAPIDDDRFDRMLEEEYDSEEVGDLEDEVRTLCCRYN